MAIKLRSWLPLLATLGLAGCAVDVTPRVGYSPGYYAPAPPVYYRPTPRVYYPPPPVYYAPPPPPPPRPYWEHRRWRH